jgi:D-alanine-D-alanine ligase
MRIGLIYDVFDAYPWQPGEAADADAEYEPEATVQALEAALEALGHTPVRVGTAHDLLRRLDGLRRDGLRLDAAVNIAEGARSRNREAYAPILLEMAGIPYVGSDALTLSLSLDKAWTKDLAAAAGLPTPPYRTYATPDAVDGDSLPGPFPLFVKPRYEGSSKGITAASKVATLDALREQVAHGTHTYGQEALVEVFVEGGGEFTVAVVGNDPPRALPALQRAVEVTTGIGLHALERRGVPPATWAYALDGALTPALEAELQRQALRIYEKLACKDFARVDFRVDAEGVPWFLEINPLPTFAPDGTFAILAELLGMSYPAFLAEVLGGALRRIGG